MTDQHADTGETAQPCDWAEVTDPGWSPSFRRGVSGLSLVFSGQCPQCRHEMRFTVAKALPDASGSRTIRQPEPLTMYCACGFPHRGHPDGDYSCGAYWTYEAVL
jgi:hypothetical protein